MWEVGKKQASTHRKTGRRSKCPAHVPELESEPHRVPGVQLRSTGARSASRGLRNRCLQCHSLLAHGCHLKPVQSHISQVLPPGFFDRLEVGCSRIPLGTPPRAAQKHRGSMPHGALHQGAGAQPSFRGRTSRENSTPSPTDPSLVESQSPIAVASLEPPKMKKTCIFSSA